MAIKQAEPYGGPGTLAEPRVRAFTVDEYYRMADSGILTEDDRVELIKGEIVQMTPIGSRHGACVDQLNQILSFHLDRRAIVRVQGPVRLDEYSEPEPDIALLTPRDDFYAESHPCPEDVLLIVEVADASVRYDREVKIPLYAKAGIPEVWLVNLQDKCVEIYMSPSGSDYEDVRRFKEGTISPQGFPGIEIDLKDILR